MTRRQRLLSLAAILLLLGTTLLLSAGIEPRGFVYLLVWLAVFAAGYALGFQRGRR